MSSKHILLLVLASLLGACSTYSTSTKTTFDSIQLSGKKPVIHVGNIQEKPDQISLLGWVDAQVTKPNWFAADATEEQVNIILAEKGKAMGADAIIYVTYNTSISSATLKRLEGRGQAVKLKDDNATIAEEPASSAPEEKRLDPNTTTKTEIVEAAAILTPAPAPAPEKTLAPTSKTTTNTAADIPTTAEEAAKIKPHSQKADNTVVSLKDTVAKQTEQEQLAQQAALLEKSVQCKTSINDINDYNTMMDSLNYMLMNAEFLEKKARGIKNGDMESAASRLVLLLKQQIDQMQKLKPAEE